MNFLYTLAQLRTPGGEIFFQAITLLAQELFAVAVICWLYWCSNKKLAYTVGFSYFSSGLLVQGLKITFRIPRPWVLDSQFQPVASAVSGATGYSFPSGHTQSATALFGSLTIHSKKQVSRILFSILILAIAFSRMYLGCHTLKDVLVALLISFGCVLLIDYIVNRKEFFSNKPFLLSAVMFFLSIVVILYAIILLKKNIIELHYAQTCIKSSGACMAFALGYYIERTYINFSMPKNFLGKILRFVIGLSIAALILYGLKFILEASLLTSFIRYFLTVLWLTAIYPYFFK